MIYRALLHALDEIIDLMLQNPFQFFAILAVVTFISYGLLQAIDEYQARKATAESENQRKEPNRFTVSSKGDIKDNWN